MDFYHVVEQKVFVKETLFVFCEREINGSALSKSCWWKLYYNYDFIENLDNEVRWNNKKINMAKCELDCIINTKYYY